MFNRIPVFSVEVHLPKDREKAGGHVRRRTVKSKLFTSKNIEIGFLIFIIERF